MLAIYTLYIARNLFVPIAVGVFGYLTLRPVTAFSAKLCIPSALSAAIVMLVLGLLVGMTMVGCDEDAFGMEADAIEDRGEKKADALEEIEVE